MGHPLLRDLLAGAIRAALLVKLHAVTGERKGYRPLGMCEKWTCLVWAVVNLAIRKDLDHHLTHPLPEDVRARELRVAAAETRLTAATIEHDAASGAGSTAVATARAAVAAAEAAVADSKRPLKFVANFCYSPKGTAKLAFLARGWTERDPNSATASDDVKEMYQRVCRKSGFDFLRLRLPRLLSIFRFFLATAAAIWFGGCTIPVATAGNGSTILCPGSATILRSYEGGGQGVGSSTILCVGSYHEACSAAQRLHQDVEMAATADDFYCNGSPVTAVEGATPPVFAALATKRRLCHEMCHVDSAPSKALVYSPTGDLTAAPSDIPGSPNFTDPDLFALAAGRARVHCYPVAGVFIGDDAACSATLLAVVQLRLKRPLQHIAEMRDTDRVHHAAQLGTTLVRLVAHAIPGYWLQTMPPDQTAEAATWADAAIAAALADLLRFADSPEDRRRLALLAAGLPIAIGGLGTQPLLAQRHPSFAATFCAVWPTCCAICPTLATIPIIASSPAPTVAAFHAAWTFLRSLLGSVRTRCAEYDRDTRVWVDGSTHGAFHPRISAALILPEPAELFGGAESTLPYRCTQRSLSAVVNSDVWFTVKAAHDAFDTANASLAAVRDREATRLVSCSQPGSGDWLRRLPDVSVRGSIVASQIFITEAQRRIGLNISALATALDTAAAAGHHVTQHHRLGDAAINAANHSHRHAAVLRAAFTTFTSLSIANEPPGMLRLGDRGDGTAAGKETARQRYAHINAGHVPDFIRFGVKPQCYELKCYTPFHVSPALGLGSTDKGGAASTADGGRFAMGNTEEALIVANLGVPERGAKADGPWRRAMGTGWVRGTLDHDYADAQRRGHPVTLLVTETTGALSPTFDRALRALGKHARAPTTHDSTRYGLSRSSPRTFLAHHRAAISAAVVLADATTISLAAPAMSFKLTMGMSPF